MSYSIAVIGAGWYGCHIAASLRSLGFAIRVFEKAARPLNAASGNNQFRLHQGFHYPRHYGTRLQSRDGFLRFIERYPDLSKEIGENIYAVPRRDSLVDYLTYRLVMTASGIEFGDLHAPSIDLCEIEGCLAVSERVVMLERARTYFRRRLGSALHLDTKAESVVETDRGVYVNGERFDFVVDATWGHHDRLPVDVIYEPTLLLYIEGDPAFPALTLVDGPLCSIYPTEEPGIYTLSSVPHTPLGQFPSAQAAAACQRQINGDMISAKADAMVRQVTQYLPTFPERFRFIGPQISMKTKPVGMADDRSCYVFRSGRTFQVLAGKIDAIFFAVERILSLLERLEDGDLTAVPSSIRADTESHMRTLSVSGS